MDTTGTETTLEAKDGGLPIQEPTVTADTPPTLRMRGQRTRYVTHIYGESKVDASQGNDTDINQVVERFTRTGVLPEPTRPPQYIDCTDLQGDLTEMLEKARHVQQVAQEFIATWQPKDEDTLPPTETNHTEPQQ